MNKFIPALLFIISISVAPGISLAQITRSVSHDEGAVNSVAGLPGNVTPEEIIKPDPTAGEKKSNTTLNHTGPGKITNPKTTPSESAKKSQNNQPVLDLDKEGNPIHRNTREEKIQLNNEALLLQENGPNPGGSGDMLTFPDLQVTATQETIVPANNISTERLPEKYTATKRVEEIHTEKTALEPPKNGKLEFLKQYTLELKVQIEKNKKDPNYPLVEKQKELEDLENLLKQE